MNFNDYQVQARSFAVYSARDMNYLIPGLIGEVGELCSLLAKKYRDEHAHHIETAMEDINYAKELGDVLWFVSTLAAVAGYNLEDIAKMNIEKLESRKQRGTIQGSGDNR